MIVAVKNNGPKKNIKKAISFLVLIIMFTAYYFHMSEEFSSIEAEPLSEEAIEQNSLMLKKVQEAKKLEKLIFREVEAAIDLIGQEYVQGVQVIDNNILITCDTNINLDPIKVRYGALALIKNSLNNVKIAINVKFIVESKYNDK